MANIIKFKSIIYKDGLENNTIKFSSQLEESEYNNFRVFEFSEPSHNIMNRIEISDREINIFAGASSINMLLQKKVPIEYSTPQGVLILTSFLYFLNKEDSKIDFKYSLSSRDGNQIGEYHIFLEIQ